MKKTIFFSVLILFTAWAGHSMDYIRGRDDALFEKSGLRKQMVEDMMAEESRIPAVTSPSAGETVSVPFTIRGTAPSFVDRVEIQIDGGSWVKASGKASWEYAVTSLAGGSHTIIARAVYEGVVGKASSPVSFSISLDIPGSIEATDGTYPDRTRITWTGITGAERYYVARASAAGGSYSDIGSTNVLQFDDTTGVNTTTYWYKVRAWSASAGYGAYSASNDGYRNFPSPGSLTASDGTYPDKTQITWAAVTAAERYYVIRATNAGGPYSDIGSTNALSYDDAIGANAVTYWYKVKAWSASAGFGVYSASNSGYRGIFAPTYITTTLDNPVYIDISWTKVQNAEGYYVYRSISSNSGYSERTNLIGTNCRDTLVVTNMPYFYRVRAWSSACGYSSNSMTKRGFSPPPMPEMVLIPAVTSWSMGRPSWSGESGGDNEQPYHEVDLNPFYIVSAEKVPFFF